MSFVLRINADAWRKHLNQTVAEFTNAGARVVPVVKGNGYGFRRENLIRECIALNVDCIAVGTIFEAREALASWNKDVVVLEPFTPSDTQSRQIWQEVTRGHAHRLIAIVASKDIASAAASGISRVRLEGETALHRFGMSSQDVDAVLNDIPDGMRIEGLTIHLSKTEPAIAHVAMLETPASASKSNGWLLESLGWLMAYHSIAADRDLPIFLSLSHVTAKDVEVLLSYKTTIANLTIEVRIGTQLWLGVPGALSVSGTVLAVHVAGLGHTKVGYTQVDSHGHDRMLVVSGGTSHGVALSAPSAPTTLRRRLIAIAQGLSEALGSVRSPFTHGGHHLVFAEPPHMHVSMLWTQDHNIAVGDELECRVRHTTAHFDIIEGL
jgi:hypothetical protein